MWREVAARAPAADGRRHDAASAFSAARSIRFTADTSTSRARRRARCGLDRVVLVIPPTCRRTGRSRARRPTTASRWWRWPCGRAPGWRVSDLELRSNGPSYTSATLDRFAGARPRHARSCSSSSAPTRSRHRDVEATTRRSSIAATSSSSRGRATGGQRCATALPALAGRMVDAGRCDHVGDAADHSDRCADGRRVIDCDPPARRGRRVDRRAGADAVAQHIEQHGLYRTRRTAEKRRMTHRSNGSRRKPAPDSRGCPARSKLAVARRRRQEGRSTSSCSICGRRRRSPTSSSSARAPTRGRCARSPTRSRRRSRAKGVKPAHVEGYDRAEWILIDYFDFIVHVFAPETRVFYGLERLWGNAERIEL